MIVPPPQSAAAGAPRGAPSSFARAVLAILLIALLVDAPRLEREVRFFQPGSLIAPDGSAPVLQDDAAATAVDAAFAAAAADLPANATCVIARHAWHRDYFRAAYLLMPRRIWPAVESPSTPITAPVVLSSLRNHHAWCLISPRDVQAPAGYLRIASGVYDLYVPAKRPRAPASMCGGVPGAECGAAGRAP